MEAQQMILSIKCYLIIRFGLKKRKATDMDLIAVVDESTKH